MHDGEKIMRIHAGWGGGESAKGGRGGRRTQGVAGMEGWGKQRAARLIREISVLLR